MISGSADGAAIIGKTDYKSGELLKGVAMVGKTQADCHPVRELVGLDE